MSIHRTVVKALALFCLLGFFVQSSADAAQLPRPTLTLTFSGNNYVKISWNSISGAVSYKIERTQLNYRGTLPNGVTNVGNVTSKKDFPYETPDFSNFRHANGTLADAACGFAMYRVAAVNSSGTTGKWSLGNWVSVTPCDLGGGGGSCREGELCLDDLDCGSEGECSGFACDCDP